MRKCLPIILFFFFINIHFSKAQCPGNCGNGVIDAGETSLGCPVDVPQGSSCSACAAPSPFETTAGLRITYDFVGTTTYAPGTLPAGWTYGGASSATTATTLPA